MEIVGKSDIGLVREQNQDSIYYGSNTLDEQLAIVCDGIGGGKAGDIASSMGVSVLKVAFQNKEQEDDIDWIYRSVNCANEAIIQEADNCKAHEGMGTTLVGALITSEKTHIFHLGDSRAYALKDNELTLLTQDHNLASDLVKAGEIDEQMASQHPKGALLTNALGIWEDASVEINTIDNNYDILLLCSDGLHGYVPEEVITSILKCSDSLNDKLDQLISQSKLAGGYDNVSIILVAGGEHRD